MWLLYTFLIFLQLGYAAQQQPLRSATETGPKRVAVIGKRPVLIPAT